MKHSTFLRIAFILLAFVFFIAGAGVIQAESANPAAKSGTGATPGSVMNTSTLLQRHFTSMGVNYSQATKMFGGMDAPVASFLSQKTGMNLTQINNTFNSSGKNWPKTLETLKVDPKILFPTVPQGYVIPEPFANAYTMHRGNIRSSTALLKLSNNEIYNLVVLNVIHDSFKTPVTTIMNERRSGKSFDDIIKMEAQKRGKSKGQSMIDANKSITINKDSYEIKEVKCPPWKEECDVCAPVCPVYCPPAAAPSPSPVVAPPPPPPVIQEEITPPPVEKPVERPKPVKKVKVKGYY